MDLNQQTIEQIAATLAHEVRNPVSVVKACLDLIELEQPESKENSNYKVMRRELDKISDILLDFLQLLKPMKIEQEDISLLEILSLAMNNAQLLSKNKVNYIYLWNCGEVTIKGDNVKLNRAFFNIYKNAVEALSDNGEITTTVEKDNDFINITICDNGVGLSDDVKIKIANPFFTTKETGTGLGVFICQNIIAEHGGTFEIGNNNENGCYVTVRLPIGNEQII